MNSMLKTFAQQRYKNSKSDLFSMFIERWAIGTSAALLGFVTPYVWMFNSSFEGFPEFIAATSTARL
jgi:hypothetical protein